MLHEHVDVNHIDVNGIGVNSVGRYVEMHMGEEEKIAPSWCTRLWWAEGTRTYTGAGTYGHVEKIKVGSAVPATDCCRGSKTQPEQESLVCTGREVAC